MSSPTTQGSPTTGGSVQGLGSISFDFRTSCEQKKIVFLQGSEDRRFGGGSHTFLKLTSWIVDCRLPSI